MKSLKLTLLGLLLAVTAVAAQSPFLAPTNPPAQYTLAWNPPSGGQPGPLTYNLYYGVQSGGYTNKQSGITNATTLWTAPARGVTFFLAVTATDTNKLEGLLSNEITITTKSPPGPPTMTPPVTLVAQSSPTVNGPWIDQPETATQLSPALAGDFFRLRIAYVTPAVVPISASSPLRIMTMPQPSLIPR